MGETVAVVRPLVRRAVVNGMHAARMRHGISILTAFIALALVGSIAGCSEADTRAQSQEPAPLLSYIGAWGERGDSPGQLDEPTCIATDAIGNVYIADAGSRFVEKFDARGGPLLGFCQVGHDPRPAKGLHHRPDSARAVRRRSS